MRRVKFFKPFLPIHLVREKVWERPFLYCYIDSLTMEFNRTSIDGVWLIKPTVFRDNRGFFLEWFSKRRFEEHGIKADFVQDNQSSSLKRGVLRGLHFQSPPHSQAKLVRVVKGSAYDVIVDLRKDSGTFECWEAFTLSAENFQMVFIPNGFAHGFCALEDNTVYIYKTDEFYAPQSEGGIIWNDPTLNIDWPIKKPILSVKDKKLPTFSEIKSPF